MSFFNNFKRGLRTYAYPNLHTVDYYYGALQFPRRRPKNNLQLLYKRKNQFNQKTRKRKFKSRISNENFIKNNSHGLWVPRRARLVGFQANNACRITYPVFIAAEKAMMPTKSNVWVKYRKFPDFFVTRKSSKARMGKGKGKIFGRVLKIKKGEIIFDSFVSHFLKTKKWVGAVRRVLPTTTKLVFRTKWAARLAWNFYNGRVWYSFAKKKRRRKKWEKQARRPCPSIIDFPTDDLRRDWSIRDFSRLYMQSGRLFKVDFIKKLWRICNRSESYNSLTDQAYLNKNRLKSLKYFVPNRLSSLGFSGGARRTFNVMKHVITSGIRRRYINFFSPDADGYFGIYKGGNTIIKRKMARQKFSTRRNQVVDSRPGKY